MVLCQMSRTITVNASTSDMKSTTTYETVERPVIFTPVSARRSQAIIHFDFKQRPDVQSTLTITESLVHGKLRLRSDLKTRDRATGKVLARGIKEHIFAKDFSDDDSDQFQIFCNGYDRTEQLGVDTPSGNAKEKLRIKAFGGPASRREYVEEDNPHFNGIFEIDYLDLFRHLLEQKSLMGDLFREVVQRTINLGFMPTGIDSYEVLGTFGEVERIQSGATDIEKFSVTQTYTTPSSTLPRVEISVEGRILRDSKSRIINEYIIDRVITHSPRGPAGGGSSTSGGRIRGQ